MPKKYNDPQTVIENDKKLATLIAYLEHNRNYIQQSLNLNKQYTEWTDEEVLEKIRDARNEAGIGGIGIFEKGDRINKFKANMAIVDKMNSELARYKDSRIDYIIMADNESKRVYQRDTEVKNKKLHDIALNWIPLITDLRSTNTKEFDSKYKNLLPHVIFHQFSEEHLNSTFAMSDMLQLIDDTDMNEFSYSDNDTFVNDFAKKYMKLKAIADGGAIIDYIREQNKKALVVENESGIKFTEVKCKMASEILKDYEIRMKLISSPYYALFAGKDFEKLSDKRLKGLKKGQGHEALDAYLDEVIAYKQLKRANATYKQVNISGRLEVLFAGIDKTPVQSLKKHSENTLELLEKKLRIMLDDTKRASNYIKVKKALEAYFDVENSEGSLTTKETRLAEVFDAAVQYLKERNKSSYGYRKARCEEVIELYGKYKMEQALEKEDEYSKTQAAEKFRVEREAELRKKADKKHEDAQGYLEDVATKEKEEAKKKVEREYEEFHSNLLNVIDNFDNLGQKGKTADDAKNARKAVLDFLAKYVFAADKKLDNNHDENHLDVIPTKMLVDALKENVLAAAKDTYKNVNYAKLIKGSISKKIWDNCASNDELRKPISEMLSKKPEDVTEFDRLNAYEYSIHVINSVNGSISHDSLVNADINKLANLGLHVINFSESGPDELKNEKLSDLSKERLNKYKNEAAEIIAYFSGKDSSLYKFLTAKTAAGFAGHLLDNIMREEACKNLIERCDKEAEAIKERHDLLTDAISTAERDKLLNVIAALSKMNKDDFDELPKADLIEVAKKMLSKIQNEKSMIKVCNDNLKPLMERSEDVYRENYLSLETNRGSGKEADQAEVRREHGYAYVKKVLGLKVVPKESLDKLDDEALYKLVSNLGIIKYADENKQDGEDLNANDLEKSINEIKSLKLGEDIKAGIEKTFGSKLPKKKVTLFSQEFDKDIDEYYEMMPIHNRGMYGRVDYEKIKKDKENHKKKEVQKKINEAVAPKKWSDDSKRMLNMISDFYLAAGKDPMGKAPMDANDVAIIVDMYPSVIANYINARNKKIESDSYKELLDGLSALERMFIEGAKPVLDSLATYFENAITAGNGGEKTIINYNQIREILKKQPIDIDFKKVTDKLNTVAMAGEIQIISHMREATDDCFDQVGGYGLPDILNVENSVEKDKEALSYVNNSLKYNKDFGQGKFLQSLMNGYYREAAPKDRRTMLSCIIRDFKNGEKCSDKQKGGNYFASSLKGAGPVMQKIMQGVPEYMVVPELRNAINVVKSDLRPIDGNEINKVIKEIIDNSNNKIKAISIDKRLGAASVAETILCTVTGPKMKPQEVVLKIRRPDAEEHMKREIPLIRKYAYLADLTKEQEKKLNEQKKVIIPNHIPKATEAAFQAQLHEIKKEFNFNNEAANIVLGEKKYIDKNTPEVQTVKLVGNIPSSEKYLVMNKAEGITLDRHVKQVRDLGENVFKTFEYRDGTNAIKHKVTLDNISYINDYYNVLNYNLKLTLLYGGHVRKVAHTWTEEALYGSAWKLFEKYNFHHGDLHSGNIMVDLKNATILDYGNASQLHKDKITIVMKMMASVFLKKPDWFVEAFEEFLKKAIAEDKNKKGSNHVGYEEIKPNVRKEYLKRLSQIFETGTQESAGIKILLALSTAQNLGIKLPMELQNFSQCQQRLENSMSEVRQAAIELKRNLNDLERIPLDDSIINSFDPLVLFQKKMLEKKDNGKYVYKNSESAVRKLLKDINRQKANDMMAEMTNLKIQASKNMNVAESVEAYKNKYYSPYKTLIGSSIGTEKLTIDSFPGKIQDFRKVYEEVKKQYKEKGVLDEKTSLDLSWMSGFFMMGAALGGVFSECLEDSYIKELHEKAFNSPYDDLAFEKLMAICEADLGVISDNSKIIDYIVNNEKITEEQKNMLGSHYQDTLNAIEASNLKNNDNILGFLSAVRDPSKDAEFSKGMERVFKNSPSIEADYINYKRFRDKFNSLKLEDGHKEFVEARKQVIKWENKLVRDYSNFCEKEYTKISNTTKDALSMNKVMNSSRIPEYVEVISKIMMDYKISTYDKLGSKFINEFNRQEAEAAEAAKKAEEAAKKAEETAKKAEELKKAGKKSEIKKTTEPPKKKGK